MALTALTASNAVTFLWELRMIWIQHRPWPRFLKIDQVEEIVMAHVHISMEFYLSLVQEHYHDMILFTLNASL